VRSDIVLETRPTRLFYKIEEQSVEIFRKVCEKCGLITGKKECTMLDKYIQKLSKEIGIEGSLATEVPGVYAFPLDEDITVSITEIPHGFTMTCTFSECPEENEEEFYTHALLANLYGEGTDGCVLGIDAEGKRLILSRKVDYDIEYNEFMDLVEDFMNSVDFWKDEAVAYGTKLG